MLQYGPILAVLNTTKTNTRIRIFHTRVKLRYHRLTTQVVSFSILTIQLLVVCLTLVWWPTTVTVKRITSPCGKKKKTRGKKRNLTAKRKRLKPKRKPRGKISSIPREHFNSYFFAVRSWLFFLPWGYSFCLEVFLFALKVNSFAVTVVGHRNFEILFPKILDFSTCGYLWELARTLLIWLAFKP